MSSAPSGRYQSKLFNFFHQRSRQLSEGTAHAFRQLQVRTSWSVQALLYPVYLLLQSTKQTELHSFRQHQSQQSTASQLPAPTADTPIQRVLMAVETLLLEEPNPISNYKAKPLNLLASNILMRLATLVSFKFLKTAYKSSFNPSPSPNLTPQTSHLGTPVWAQQGTTAALPPQHSNIQGIATQLSTRTLVLVTAQNEILDILTPQQQQRLQQRIMGEVAEYWRYWRSADLPPATDTILPPLRGFQQLTGWAETVSTVLFALPRKIVAGILPQESRFRSQTAAIAASPVEAELIVYPYQVLTFLDRTVAELESSVVPLSQTAIALTQRSRELIHVLHRFGMSWLRKEPVSTPPEFPPSTTERTLRIEALIWRAVDYFFGDRHQQLPTASTDPTWPHCQASQFPATQPRLFVSTDEDPWLTMSDLFDQSVPVESLNGHQPEVSQTSERQNVLPSNDLVGSIWQAMRRLSHRLGRSPQPAITSGAEEIGTAEIATQFHSHSQVDFAPDWIETPATAVGYVKHPFEKLLEWLDRAMLWLEKVVVGVWQWLVAKAR